MEKVEIEGFIKKSQEESEIRYKKTQRMRKELRDFNSPILHYIFTLKLHEGSFLALSSVDGWNKYIKLNIDLFNEFFSCKIIQQDSVKNPEQFILREIRETDRSYCQQMRKCSFEGVEFEVYTNGKDFEIVLNPLDKVLNLDFSDSDSHKLAKFFKRWAGEVLVKNLDLDEYIDERLYKYTDIYESVYDAVLDLDFHSFVIYTYPDSMDSAEIETLIKNGFFYPTKPISANIWINNGACIRQKHPGYPPFQECFVHIHGHVPMEFSSESKACLSVLFRHMKFWSMVYMIENFMGMITEFQDLEIYNIDIKKIDILKGLLFGIDREHDEAESLRDIRQSIHRFLYLGLKSNHRGLEEEASEQYLPKYIAGEYFNIFEESKMGLTKKVLDNATVENITKLKEEFHEIWTDLEKRIENLEEATRDLERKYYQEYQLKLVEKTQELTLLSIMTAILIFLISKLPWDQAIQKLLIFWGFLSKLLFPHYMLY